MAEVLDPRSGRLTRGVAARAVHATRVAAHTRPPADAAVLRDVSAPTPQAAIPLVARLCEELRSEGVSYCQF